MVSRRLPAALAALAVVIGLLHAAGLRFGWYYSLPWLDVALHLAGGFWVGSLFVYLFRWRFPVPQWLRRWKFTLFGVGFVALVGVGWEVYELLVDVFVLDTYAIDNAPGSVHADSLADLVNDIIGGALALVWMGKGKSEPPSAQPERRAPEKNE